MKIKKIPALILIMCFIVTLFPLNLSADEAAIKFDKESVSVTAGKTYQLNYSVKGEQNYKLTWATSNKNIVKVLGKGKITALKAGTATVKVTVKFRDMSSYSALCRVTVKDDKTATPSANINTTPVKKTDNTKPAQKAEIKEADKPVQKPGISSAKDSMEFVKKIKVGWNLGNTLDSTGIRGVNAETYWKNPKTTKEMFDEVKKAGFDAVRIPVSWGGHMDSSGKIEQAWLSRVKEVVDYAYNNGFYVILNSHHDTEWIKLTENDEAATTKRFITLWKQIAECFNNYDEYLIFESMNEPRTVGSAREWQGGTEEERRVVNNLNKAFIDTVRASGGKNSTRYLMIPPYAASSGALSGFNIPEDNRLIISVHSYAPYNMALNRDSSVKELDGSGKNDITSFFNTLNSNFISKGIPVIIGECGWINKDNEKERVEAAEYYIETANKYSIPVVLWDNNSNSLPSGGEGFGLLDRRNLKWYYEDLVKAIVNTAE